MRAMKRALAIGIDNYLDAPLEGCANDAGAVSELLRANGDGSPNFEVMKSTDIDTKNELHGATAELFLGEEDIALFFFSGHGSEDGYLITPDHRPRNLGVPMRYVIEQANNSKFRNKVIILDTCFSGQTGELPISMGTESVLCDGITIMASCRRFKTSAEIGDQGLFTSLLLQGLRESAADVTGRITPASIYAFINQSLGAWQQRPVFKTNTSSFISLRDIEPRVPKATLRRLHYYFESVSSEFSLDQSLEFTNSPEYKVELIEPHAKPGNVTQLKELQLFESVGLVEPVGEEHMYFAAMHGKSCKLTAWGAHYWQLSRDARF